MMYFSQLQKKLLTFRLLDFHFANGEIKPVILAVLAIAQCGTTDAACSWV